MVRQLGKDNDFSSMWRENEEKIALALQEVHERKKPKRPITLSPLAMAVALASKEPRHE